MRKPTTKGKSLKIKDIITSDVRCISPEVSLTEAAKTMRMFDVGILLVGEEDCMLGSVTDRDITIRAVAEGLDPKTAKVRRIMTRGVVSCFQERNLEEAGQMMREKNIRHLRVLDEGSQPVGMVSLPDAAVLALDRALASGVLERVFSPSNGPD